jgi:hypothetical protein
LVVVLVIGLLVSVRVVASATVARTDGPARRGHLAPRNRKKLFFRTALTICHRSSADAPRAGVAV